MRHDVHVAVTTTEADALPARLSAVAVIVAGLLVLLSHELGPRAWHMALHIAVMNVLAPLSASLWPARSSSTRRLWLAGILQLALLWAWHVPAVERIASASPGGHALALLTLFLPALLFWRACLGAVGSQRWQAIAALLLTGKLTCLLAALLVFSPRLLYPGSDHVISALDDQQLAGLLMITACPLSYLVAAVTIATRLVSASPASVRPHPRRAG
jgi:putative membrane protein